MRDPENWPWLCIEKTLEGVTLKHVVDNIITYPVIRTVPGSPILELETYMYKWLETGSNINMKYDPVECPPLEDKWNDWSTAMTAEELQSMPLTHEFKVDLEHVAINPVALQPAKTNNLICVKNYLVSPRKVVSH